MNLTGKNVTLHDMSLRDGMHAKRHQIRLEQMVAVATGLDAAGMPLDRFFHERIAAPLGMQACFRLLPLRPESGIGMTQSAST